jgi:integrase
MRASFGPLSVTLKNTYLRGGTLIFQRAVPKDLQDRYPGKTIKHDLKTAELAKAARMVADLNRKLEAEWDGLRAAPEASPKALKVHADAFLKQFGLRPGVDDNDPDKLGFLYDHFDAKRARFAGGNEEVHRDAHPTDYLNPVEATAWRRLHATEGDTLGDLLEVYLRAHKDRDNAKFVTYQRRALATLTAVVGDREVSAFTRDDARRYIEVALTQGKSTGTIRRRVNSLRAMWSSYRREKDPATVNPWERIAIAGEGQDKQERQPFTADELAKLIAACRAKDDDVRWLIAMLADTGARLAEIVGLPLTDIHLDDSTPYIALRHRPWRRLKNDESERDVPLLGAALWAAKRVVQAAHEGQRFAFPRYTNEAETKATSASGATASWIRGRGLDHTCHDLRHTMADRLRDVGCPKAIAFSIDGHATKDVGDAYGRGYNLRIKAAWLAKVVGNPELEADHTDRGAQT